jgi:hypothetical protein
MSIGIGDRVRLRIAAYGKPGVVMSDAHGVCKVRWDDLELETKHRAKDLISAEDCERGVLNAGR